MTIGELWKFLALEGTTVRIDSHNYHSERIAKTVGILLFLTTDGRQRFRTIIVWYNKKACYTFRGCPGRGRQ